jgi:hypothetical protein
MESLGPDAFSQDLNLIFVIMMGTSMKTKASQRLQMSDTQLRAQTRQLITAHFGTGPRALELPQYRYVDDVQRHLNQLHARLQDLASLAKVQQNSLASVNRQRVVRATVTQLNKKIGPSVRKLEAQYNLIQDLHELYRTAETVEAQLCMQFDGRTGSTVDQVRASIQRLKVNSGEQMKQVFAFLEDVAKKHVPAKFKTMAGTVNDTLAHRAPELNVGKTFLYASVCPKGNLMFTHYAYLADKVKTEGSPNHLYASVQWVLGANETWVQLNHEFETPDQLYSTGPGQRVDGADGVVNAVLALLSSEGVEVLKPVIKAKKQPETTNTLIRALSYL